MSRLVYCSLLVLGSIGFVGCGGSVDEVPPLSGPGNDPPAEQQKNWKEESMKQGGAPKGYKPPEAETN